MKVFKYKVICLNILWAGEKFDIIPEWCGEWCVVSTIHHYDVSDLVKVWEGSSSWGPLSLLHTAVFSYYFLYRFSLSLSLSLSVCVLPKTFKSFPVSGGWSGYWGKRTVLSLNKEQTPKRLNLCFLWNERVWKYTPSVHFTSLIRAITSLWFVGCSQVSTLYLLIYNYKVCPDI